MPQFAPCPKCSGTEAKPVSFTWWGGVLGPKLLSHVRCDKCGTAYNGKSGNLNNTAIIIYMVVLAAIVLCLIFAFRSI